MSRKPNKRPKPSPSPTVVVADKQKAAIGQLESAILLWFNEADPISILVLASNARLLSRARQEAQKAILASRVYGKAAAFFPRASKLHSEFAKHGYKDLDESTPFEAILADGLMLISIECHAQIFGLPMRPLLALYWARAFREHPRWIGDPSERLPQVMIESGIIDDVARGSRKECLKKHLPFFQTAYVRML